MVGRDGFVPPAYVDFFQCAFLCLSRFSSCQCVVGFMAGGDHNTARGCRATVIGGERNTVRQETEVDLFFVSHALHIFIL